MQALIQINAKERHNKSYAGMKRPRERRLSLAEIERRIVLLEMFRFMASAAERKTIAAELRALDRLKRDRNPTAPAAKHSRAKLVRRDRVVDCRTSMPVNVITIAEIVQRQLVLSEQVVQMPPGPERDHVLAEIELLHGLLQFKWVVGAMRPQPTPCSPPTRSRARRLPTPEKTAG